MQHGTAREYLTDLLENASAILGDIYIRHGIVPGLGETKSSILRALQVLEEVDGESFDDPGVYGVDYGFGADSEARTFRDGPFQVPNPVGRIREEDDIR